MSYASEICLPQMRGTVLSSYAFFFAFGQLLCAITLDIINRVCSTLKSKADSRLTPTVSARPSIRNLHSSPYGSPSSFISLSLQCGSIRGANTTKPSGRDEGSSATCPVSTGTMNTLSSVPESTAPSSLRRNQADSACLPVSRAPICDVPSSRQSLFAFR